MLLGYTDWEGNQQTVNATITTDHPASSYGQAVIITGDDNGPLDLASFVLLDYHIIEATDQERALMVPIWERIALAAGQIENPD